MFAHRNFYMSECAERGGTVELGGGAGLGVAMREGSVSGEAGVFEISSRGPECSPADGSVF